MRNFWNLTKIYFINLISNTTQIGNKKGKYKFATTFSLIVLLFILVALSLGFQYYETAEILSQFDMTYYIFFSSGVTTLLVLIMMITFEASGHIFKTKDYESLAALPIKSVQVVMSKIVSVLLSSYLYTFILLLPVVIVYFIFVPITFLTFITIVLGIILFPIIPTCISIFIGLIIAYISNKSKISNTLTIIFTFIFVFAMMGCVLFLNNYIQNLSPETDFTGLLSLKCLMPTVMLFMTGAVQLNVIDLLIYVILNLVILAITIFIIMKIYVPVNKSLLNQKFVKTNVSRLSFKQKDVFGSLLDHESKKYFGTPFYIFNSSFGLLFMLAIPILLKLNIIKLLVGDVEISNSLILFFAVVCTSMTSAMTITTNSSISLEGKSFYILKSLPISFKKIAFSKIIFNVLVGLPFILLTAGMYIMFFPDVFLSSQLNSIAYIVLSIALPLLAILTFAVFGFLANLIYPKTNYVNVVQVVKQSAAVFVTVMPALFIHIAIIIMYFQMPTLTIIDFAMIMMIIYGIMLAISTIVLRHKGKKLFNRIG